MVSSGAPDNSNCPPGSSEIAPPPVTSARPMMFGPSIIGSQPSKCCMPTSSEWIETRPLYGTGSGLPRGEGNFPVRGADAPLPFGLGPLGDPRDDLAARFDRGQVDNVTSH